MLQIAFGWIASAGNFLHSLFMVVGQTGGMRKSPTIEMVVLLKIEKG